MKQVKNKKTRKNKAHKSVIGKKKRVSSIITTPINDGLFFYADFEKLPRDSMIYIKSGTLFVRKKIKKRFKKLIKEMNVKHYLREKWD
jgi:hypothetical protein